MKVLIPILIGLLVVGCGKKGELTEETDTNESTPTTNTNKSNGTAENSVKELTKEGVVGSFESEEVKIVLHGNGQGESYIDGEKVGDGKWKIVGKEVHVSIEGDVYEAWVFTIGTNGDLTAIAYIDDGKRQDFLPKELPKGLHHTFKKIKSETKETPPKPTDQNASKSTPVKELTKEDVIGTYEMKVEEATARMVILKNGIVESYLKDEKVDDGNVSIINGEVHIKSKTNEGVSVLRHEPNGDLTDIAKITDGKRTDFPKEDQDTWKKIK